MSFLQVCKTYPKLMLKIKGLGLVLNLQAQELKNEKRGRGKPLA